MTCPAGRLGSLDFILRAEASNQPDHRKGVGLLAQHVGMLVPSPTTGRDLESERPGEGPSQGRTSGQEPKEVPGLDVGK